MLSGASETDLIMKRKLTLIILIFIAAVSCIQEIRHEVRETSDKEITFKATEYEAYITRSGSEDASAPESRRMFLGMAGNDSLFITATVSEMTESSKIGTKAEPGVAKPEHFHIAAFKDDAQEPYLTLPLRTENNWESYSPTLYWPYEYNVLHFFAWAYNISCDIISPSYSVGEQFAAEFNYTIPSSETQENDAEVQPDLIFAIAPSQKESDDPVHLGFVHALSAVEFKIGTIGDATVVKSVININNILSKGHCTITNPVTPANITWTPQEPLDSYSQTVKDGVPFMIVPQSLDVTGAEFQIDITIGDITHEFPAKKLSELTPKWETNKKYTYTINKGGEVRVGVNANLTEQNNKPLLENVKIQNTGFSTSYIRAAIVGYWYSIDTLKLTTGEIIEVESIASSWEINDGSGVVSIPESDWGWAEGGDGFYYYKNSVVPGDSTSTLFKDYRLDKTQGPVDGAKLKVHIITQAQSIDTDNEYKWNFFQNSNPGNSD